MISQLSNHYGWLISIGPYKFAIKLWRKYTCWKKTNKVQFNTWARNGHLYIMIKRPWPINRLYND